MYIVTHYDVFLKVEKRQYATQLISARATKEKLHSASRKMSQAAVTTTSLATAAVTVQASNIYMSISFEISDFVPQLEKQQKQSLQ